MHIEKVKLPTRIILLNQHTIITIIVFFTNSSISSSVVSIRTNMTIAVIIADLTTIIMIDCLNVAIARPQPPFLSLSIDDAVMMEHILIVRVKAPTMRTKQQQQQQQQWQQSELQQE